MNANSGSPGSSSPNTSVVDAERERVREQHRADEVERRHDRAHERHDDQQDDDDGQRRHQRRVGAPAPRACRTPRRSRRRAAPRRRPPRRARRRAGAGSGAVAASENGSAFSSTDTSVSRESREWLTIVVDATAGSASSAAITPGALCVATTRSTGAARPGPNSSWMSASARTDSGSERKASVKSSVPLFARLPSAPAASTASATAVTAPGRAATSAPTRRHVRPGPAAGGAHAGHRQQRRQEREAGEHHDGDADGQHRAHPLRGADVGDAEHEHRRHDRAARRQDRRRRARAPPRRASPDLAAARDEQQAVVGARPEHEHDEDRRGLAGDLEGAGLRQRRRRSRPRSRRRRPTTSSGSARQHRRPVGHEQRHEDERHRDGQQQLVDALERLAGVGREGGRPGDVAPTARRTPGRARAARSAATSATTWAVSSFVVSTVIEHRRAVGRDHAPARVSGSRPPPISPQSIPYGVVDGLEVGDRLRVAQRLRLGGDLLVVGLGQPARPVVGDDRRDLLAEREPLVEQVVDARRLRGAAPGTPRSRSRRGRRASAAAARGPRRPAPTRRSPTSACGGPSSG